MITVEYRYGIIDLFDVKWKQTTTSCNYWTVLFDEDGGGMVSSTCFGPAKSLPLNWLVL